MKKIIENYKLAILPPYKPADIPVIFATALLLILVLFAINVTQKKNTRNIINAEQVDNIIETENGTLMGDVLLVDHPDATGGKYTLLGSRPTSVPNTQPPANITPTASPATTSVPTSTGCNPNQNIITTGSDRDIYDCMIIEQAKKYGHPSPRILKSQIEWESHFDIFATSSDSPCGTYSGWTSAESKSFGLFQITPACGEGGPVLLPNGRPNLTKDQSSTLWTTSVYNPTMNIELGAKYMAQGYFYFKKQFPGCTDNQYILMAAAGYVQDWDTIVGCNKYTDSRQTAYINAVLNAYNNFAGQGGWPNFSTN